MISRETSSDFTKQESSSTSHHDINFSKNIIKASSTSTTATATATTTTTSWSRLKDPRIVRVSRAFGGKDRHSKVCTVRGLRDRRVRLSVPTAIQLYDLQDRLGLNQPSKVVDWLLNAAKSEIDELPPLQFPQGASCFSTAAALLPMLNNSDKQGLKSKDVVSAETCERQEEWARSSEEGRHGFNLGINQDHSPYVSTENQNQNPSSMMNTCSIPFNSFVRWDPSNLTLSHPPSSPCSSSPHQGEDNWHNFSLSHHHHLHHHHHQVLAVYQPTGMTSAAVQPYFQSQNSASNVEFNAKQINFQTSHLSNSSLASPSVESSTLPARPIHFNMTANLLPSQNNDGS